jgi:hypothetical protein
VKIIFVRLLVIVPSGALTREYQSTRAIDVVWDEIPWNTDFQLFGGCRLPAESYFGGRQMYQSRLGSSLFDLDCTNHSCYNYRRLSVR